MSSIKLARKSNHATLSFGCIYTDTPHSAFSYKDDDPDGPSKWATLHKDWAVCDSGKEQSPIDIAKVEVSKDLGPLEQTYKAGAAAVQNRGHDFMVRYMFFVLF
jgi:carbonic anhydrase